MENTPTVCADYLPTILRILKNDPTSRSVNNSLQRLDFDPSSINNLFYQPKLRPVWGHLEFYMEASEVLGSVGCNQCGL